MHKFHSGNLRDNFNCLFTPVNQTLSYNGQCN